MRKPSARWDLLINAAARPYSPPRKLFEQPTIDNHTPKQAFYYQTPLFWAKYPNKTDRSCKITKVIDGYAVCLTTKTIAR